ncbi:inorganic phosphate transporter [Flavobacterium sp. NRK F7]|uniref:inorganic phosphate transporter n=1 Tax=Flavobacterium sp. NRK F7 TaxID=2954930 RepID=UPI002090ED9A|nr:inorganic phosphate transporter [Flavobacterium sp. NRK F7]MCO6162190.1 inorganic phosphate transporter [Flavobacterium sp. NRK F7]
MEQIYLVMLVALALLASIDLMVGVANDAVNFLNSGIGSKAVSFKTLMIVASIGIALGALFSSGMMEIARSGIFVPAMFTFNDVMIIFLAVMITDVLLLDIFNSLGLPTSTTVSVVFSLLGGAVCLGVYKMISNANNTNTILDFINQEKATEIVSSILISVALSFTIGALIQYVSRIIFSFHYEKRIKYFGAIFGGIGITAITYFILFKGLKSSSFMTADVKELMKSNQMLIIAVCFVFWTLLSQVLISLKVNIFRIIIIIGTFALALAFAGNDLVNFIGVPIAALQSYDIYIASGSDSTMLMGALASSELKANFWLLLIGGGIMVYTLWTSKKAKEVIATGVDLSRQSEGTERFDANNLSRVIVRGVMYIGQVLNYFLPKSLEVKIDKQFTKVVPTSKKSEQPAFDMVRASVNLMVASILIAIGTSLKLPLSTTYVTFMVAMGTSFADRAWDRESAVYRVAGVINVIGGWFVTAFVAFLMAGTIAVLLTFGKVFAFFALMVTVGILLYRSARKHMKKTKEKEEEIKLKKEDIFSIKEVISESSSQVGKVIRKTNALYTDVINNLGLQDLAKLKDNKKKLKKLEKDIDDLKSNVYYVIKNLDETSLEASKFYVLILGYLQDMVQSIGYITVNSHSHINNNHKQLKFNQIRDLKSVDNKLKHLFDRLTVTFQKEDFSQIDEILKEKANLLESISELIQKQIIRIRTTENSPKNSKLYFGLLLETNDLVKATMNLLELFKEFNKQVEKKK